MYFSNIHVNKYKLKIESQQIIISTGGAIFQLFHKFRMNLEERTVTLYSVYYMLSFVCRRIVGLE